MRWQLREWRTFRGLTQEQLAERVGGKWAKGDISNLEKGRRRYNQDSLESLAEALNCTPADLLSRDPREDEGILDVWRRVVAAGRAADGLRLLRALLPDDESLTG